jgi:glutamate/tyrosine decarboxylase-like PLP-dependent enzyme
LIIRSFVYRVFVCAADYAYALTKIAFITVPTIIHVVNVVGVCSRYPTIHVHVDAAYAGAALLCPEFCYLADDMEYAHSFNFNAHKWMLTTFDCSCYSVTDRVALQNAISSDMSIYRNVYEGGDLRNWQVPLGRRFRSLKLWCVMRAYGIVGLQRNIRRQCTLAEAFEDLVRGNDRFEIIWEAASRISLFSVTGREYAESSVAGNVKCGGTRTHLPRTVYVRQCNVYPVLCLFPADRRDPHCLRLGTYLWRGLRCSQRRVNQKTLMSMSPRPA